MYFHSYAALLALVADQLIKMMAYGHHFKTFFHSHEALSRHSLLRVRYITSAHSDQLFTSILHHTGNSGVFMSLASSPRLYRPQSASSSPYPYNPQPPCNASTVPVKRKRSWSRAVFTSVQRKELEKRFELQKYVNKPDRRQLASTLGLTDTQV